MVHHKQAKVSGVGYIGWLGVEGCEVLSLHEHLTGLVGTPGAGKSTLLMALAYAFVPDRSVLDIRPLSKLNDPRTEGTDPLIGRVSADYGYAHVVLDMRSHQDERVVAGIQIHSEGGSAVLSYWYVKNRLEDDLSLSELMAGWDGDDIYYPSLIPLRGILAARGIDLHICRTVGEYGQVLYDTGIIPTPLTSNSDRRLYAALLAATFQGGLSDDVVRRLKDYLLQEPLSLKELVDGLQECISQLARTRLAIADAERDLFLLQSTFSIGRQLVKSATGSLRHDISQNQSEWNTTDSALKKLISTVTHLNNSIAESKKYSEATEKLKTRARLELRTRLRQAREEEAQLELDLASCQLQVDAHTTSINKFKRGRDIWNKLTKQREERSLTALSDALDVAVVTTHRDAVLLDIAHEAHRNEHDRIAQGLPSDAMRKLLLSAGGRPLENEWHQCVPSELEGRLLSIAGMVDGLVGASVEQFARIPPTAELPDILWVGPAVPKPVSIARFGEWCGIEQGDGMILASRAYLDQFGATGTHRRLEDLKDTLERLASGCRRARRRARVAIQRRDFLTREREMVAHYFEHAEGYADLAGALADMQSLCRRQKEKMTKLQNAIDQMDLELDTVELPYDQELKLAQDRLSNLEHQMQECESRRTDLEKTREACEAAATTLQSEWSDIVTQVGEDSDVLAGSDPERHEIGLQMRRISELKAVLGVDTAKLVPALDQANPEDRLSVVRIWPQLAGAIREQLSVDAIDCADEELIQRAIARRQELDQQLAHQEEEMRINARSLYLHISSNVKSQRTRIARMSEFGASLKYGNITGIQVVVEPREAMLTLLAQVTERSIGLSSQKPVQDSLAELFREAASLSAFSGDQLLDYRNYLDLVIEVRRTALDWEPAHDLSGTEAIGGGLAIALMLARSISSRAMPPTERRPPHSSPVFVIDELGRINHDGHNTLIEFARREGFQLVVTSQAMEPQLPCYLYALSRTYAPSERLTVRALRIKEPL